MPAEDRPIFRKGVVVYQFHKANGFFPVNTGAFKPQLGDDVIKGRAEKLFEDLQEPLNEHSRRTARRPIWSSLVFEIPAEVVD